MAQGWKKDYSRYKSFFLDVLSVYNSKPNLRIYLELILSVTTIVVFALFAIKPTILTIVEINKDIKSKEATIVKLKTKIDNLQLASNILQKQSQNLSLINNSVPNNAEIEKFISQLESVAINNTVQINSLSSTELLLKGTVDEKRKASDLSPLPSSPNELPISFSISGQYQNLYSFLQSVENLRRPAKIDTLIFTSSKSVEDASVITLTIAGRVPYLMVEESTTKEN